MVVLFKPFVIAAVLWSTNILGHPGHDVVNEVAQRAAYMKTAERRNLAHCSEKLKEQGVVQRSIARRQMAVERLRTRSGIERRDFGKALNTSHHSSQNYTSSTSPEVLFAGNASCILSPEVTEGPYYVSGEYVRQNVIEKEPGVPLTYEVQIIDVKTCKPLHGVLLEMWHSNSTGVYGGVAAGNPAGIADDRELNNTMLRGIQPSDKDGIITFKTIFPGHYTGRTPHIHMLAHLNATILPNKTITGGTVSHVGQIFFDQSLISAVELTAPYNTNKQPLVTNAQDFIMAQEAENGDPVIEYTYVGSKVEEGLFGWIAFGVDASANRTVNAAANYGAGGGKTNPNPVFPGFPFPSGGFPFPSGGFPSGFPPFPSGAFPSGFPGFPSGFPFPTNLPGFPSFPGAPQQTPAPTTSSQPMTEANEEAGEDMMEETK